MWKYLLISIIIMMSINANAETTFWFSFDYHNPPSYNEPLWRDHYRYRQPPSYEYQRWRYRRQLQRERWLRRQRNRYHNRHYHGCHWHRNHYCCHGYIDSYQ